jgi:ferredoxin
MTKKIYTKEEWIKALAGLKSSYNIFVPVRDGDFHTFKALDEKKIPDFNFKNTQLSPKSLIYPQSERLFEYTLDENDPDANILRESVKDYSPWAVIGIRPCDAHAFQIVRPNFAFVGLGCNDPGSTCFCTSVGGGPFSEKGLDVLLYDLGDSFLVKALTEKGETFLNQAQGGKEADEKTLKAGEDLAGSAADKIEYKVSTDKLKDRVQTELFNAPFWDDVAFACINCGTCTYLCPTCWCFDIQDEVLGKQGDRIRNWDSCMFPLFTLHGSGHNPRARKVQRVRQRFMHKLKYYVDKYNNGVQCSGCGRCVKNCPANIDIRQVCEMMNGYRDNVE